MPPCLASLLRGARWSPVPGGESGCRVWCVTAPGRPAWYVKFGAGLHAHAVADEMLRLRWLAPRLPVPDLVHFAANRDRAWLVTTALRGATAYDCMLATPTRRQGIVRAVARFLRRLHALPSDDCPFDASAALQLAAAGRNMRAGRVDADAFDAERAGWSVPRVWRQLQQLRPPRGPRVVTHGDASLRNVLVADRRVTGCIDVGRLGVADPYRDLAILWRELHEFGPRWPREFLRAYGLPRLDRRRREFHLCLDEFF